MGRFERLGVKVNGTSTTPFRTVIVLGQPCTRRLLEYGSPSSFQHPRVVHNSPVSTQSDNATVAPGRKRWAWILPVAVLVIFGALSPLLDDLDLPLAVIAVVEFYVGMLAGGCGSWCTREISSRAFASGRVCLPSRACWASSPAHSARSQTPWSMVRRCWRRPGRDHGPSLALVCPGGGACRRERHFCASAVAGSCERGCPDIVSIYAGIADAPADPGRAGTRDRGRLDPGPRGSRLRGGAGSLGVWRRIRIPPTPTSTIRRSTRSATTSSPGG
jgi:hypothetical protein